MSPYKKTAITSLDNNGILWYDVYTGYNKLQTKKIPQTMEPDVKKRMSRRASLISKEDMAKLQI
jgi:hypothetical protein